MNFTNEDILRVWWKATPVLKSDERIVRKDKFGALIKLFEYGNKDSKFGWGIVGDEKNGLDNLTPLHWENIQNARAENQEI